MAQQIIWTKKAKKELIDILQYWINRNKSNTFSIKLNSLIENQLNTIAEYPKVC
jgi:toxin YoeB